MEYTKLYYSITEVSEMLGVNASHLRFLETQFPEIKPTKANRGVRKYAPQDIELLRRILHLTKEQGFTFEGARAQLKGDKTQSQIGAESKIDERMQLIENLKNVRQFLVDLKESM